MPGGTSTPVRPAWWLGRASPALVSAAGPDSGPDEFLESIDPGGSARICRGGAPGPLPCGRAHLFAVDDTRITSVKPTPVPDSPLEGAVRCELVSAGGPTPIKGQFHRRSDEFLESIKKGVETPAENKIILHNFDVFPGVETHS
jgi:hypothetical protein